MSNEPSSIKILLKYYNNSQDNTISNSLNNEIRNTASNSHLNNNHNPRYSSNSLMSNDNNNNTNNGSINIKIIKKNKNKINSRSNTNISIMSELTQDYLIHFKTNYPYNHLENEYPPKIINIKTCIYLYLVDKKKMNITLDSLLLFKLTNGKFNLLNDEDYFYPRINSKIKNNKNCINNYNKKTDNSENKNNITNSTIIYYNINKDKIKVIVELYSKSIDRISLNISKMCSLLMLKYMVMLKLKEIEKTDIMTKLIKKGNNESFNNDKSTEFISAITMDEIEKKVKIYGNGIVNKDFTEYLSKKETNRNFNNNTIISEIYNYYINSQNSQNVSSINSNNDNTSISNNNKNILTLSKDDEGALNFIMMEQKGNKCCLGLDFRFTILQYFLPLSKEECIEYDKSDMINFKSPMSENYFSKNGLNLFLICSNKECKYNNKCFILNVGYGNYDLFNLIKYNAYCPFCNKSKQEFINKNMMNNNIKNNLELKYIGMMNSQWAYKGYLNGIKMTIIDGKGMTVMNDIIYKTKDFDFLHQFKKLVFQIERYISKNNYEQIMTKNSINNSEFSEELNIINENYEKNKISETENEENLEEENENLNKINLDGKFNSEISNTGLIFNDTSINKNTNMNVMTKANTLNITNKTSTIIDNYTNYKENEKTSIINNYNNITNSNLNISNNNINMNNSKINTNNSFNKINEYNHNIKNMINYNYNNNIIKKIRAKKIGNGFRKVSHPKTTYFGNGKQYIQNIEGNETKNTNIDFNIIIDKTKSKCCDNCFDIEQTTQVCSIF